MKKIPGLILFVIMAFILIFSPNSSVKAEDGLKITNWSTDSSLNTDGSLDITEDITFKFSSKFNGVFRDIYLKDTSGVENISVSLLQNGTEVPYKKADRASNGDTGVYEIIKNSSYDEIKIFSPSNNEEKTFRFRYRVLNTAVKYRDTGELYYNYIGKENKTEIDSVHIKLQLPVAGRNLKAYVHGPIDSTVNVSGNGAGIEALNIKPGELVALRAIFPVENLSLCSKIVDQNAYNSIISQEDTYMVQQEQTSAKAKQMKSLADYGAIFMTIAAAVFFAALSFKFRRKEKYDPDKYYNELPEDCTPAVMKMLFSNFVGTNEILATLLDLSRKGYIKLENTEENFGKNNKYSDFAVIKLKGPDNDLLEHEKFLIAWLVDKIGYGGRVSLSEIKENSKSRVAHFTSNFNQWKALVKKETKQRGYFDVSGKKYGLGLVMFSIAMFVLSFVFVVFGSNYGVVCLFFSILLFVYGIRMVYRRSDYGNIMFQRWKNFRKYYRENEVAYIMESYVPYAISLGMDKKTFEKYKNKYTTHQYNNAEYFWLYWYFTMNTGNNSGAFNDSFNSAFGSTGSSGSSSSTSGGAGGGGAGGF